MSDSDMSQNVPAYTRWNPPGRKELSYRAGTYTTVLSRLMDYLAERHEPQGQVPELQLNDDPQENWGVGLLQAWAIVIDVLTFYQERFANEGYLSTATERRSILELARSTGYELRPGVSASTYLAFTVGPVKNGTSLSCVIPAGTAVQSVPTQGQQVLSFPAPGQPPAVPQLPQTFETSEEFEARSEWNAILLAKSSSVGGRTFRPGTTSLRLDGVKTNLKPGDVLLLIGDDASYNDQNRPWIFATLQTIEPDSQKWYTRVTWESEIRHSDDPTPIKTPRIFAFRLAAKPFGYTRGGVSYSQTNKADWSPSSVGLPNTGIHALIQHKSDSLFAATDNGVFRSLNSGETWEVASSGLLKLKVQALASGDDGTLYAGTSSGAVFFSDDNGNNWRLIVNKPNRRVGLLALLPLPRPRDTALPKTVIHDLTTYMDGATQYLVAATDEGVFQSPDGGLNWRRPPTGVSAQEVTKRGSAWAFAARKGRIPFVGMDTGVYPVEVKQGINWRLIGSVIAIIIAVIALVLFVLGVLNDNFGAPPPPPLASIQNIYDGVAQAQLPPAPPTPCAIHGCVGGFPAYLVALISLFFVDVFLIAVFIIAGQRPLLDTSNNKFAWLIRHWHALRNATIISVIVFTLLYIPVALSYIPQLADSQFGVWIFNYGTAYHNFLRFILIAYFIIAVLFAIFLLIWWLIPRPQATSLPVTVRALAFQGDGALLAGTAQGIYRSRDNGQSWQWIQQGPANALFTVPVDANLRVEDLNDGHIPDALSGAFADNGVELAPDTALTVITAGQLWKLSAPDSPSLYTLAMQQGQIQVALARDVRAFETRVPSLLFAGTQDGRVFQAQESGDSWSEFSNNLELAQVQVLLAGAGGLFAAGLPGSTDTENQWTRFQLRERRIDLDKLYPALVSNSWVALRQDGDVAVYKAVSVGPTVRKDFARGKDFTSITVSGPAQLGSFNRNSATILMQSEQLPLFDDQPVQGDTLPLGDFVPGLNVGQKLVVSGKRLRLRVTGQLAAPFLLMSADSLRQASFTPDDALVVMGITATTTPDVYTWQLRDRSGFVGSFTAPMAVISYEPAPGQDEVVSELITVLAVQAQTATTLKLVAPLNNVYDRSSATICANVVPATHGQTIENEVLGSVDMRRDIRRFMLKQKPLTYTSPVEAEEHLPATLQVLVNGVPWQQAQWLFGLSSNQRAYVVQNDSQDNTWLIFGNGTYGAHLPGGREHITATYRIGSGEAGNVPANSLTMLRRRPPGIQRVTNPVSASGGADPESNDMARINAPLHVQQTMLRIVSFNDYEHFARAYAGIGKVQVQTLWNGRRHLAYMTIAGEDGQQIDTTSIFYQNLRRDVSNAVLSPAQPVEIAPCETLYFQLEATLVLQPGYAASSVTANVTQKLSQTFGFDRRQLAQPVSASEVIVTMQDVSGVAGVKLKNLFIKGQAGALNPLLEAKAGRLEVGKLYPAQLLLIDADEQGITLTVE
ncbi:MAG TPA: baseplate J/gp47 family protein [Ktedonobacteraceae bacterium]|nr:baseplate J/gp47 family protein [Ktedonobacteraceae bacterium]